MTSALSRNIFIVLLFASFALMQACKTQPIIKPMRIALSSGSPNYVNWVHRGDSTAVIIDMKGMEADSALKLLAGCDAIIFTGGEDVEPVYYGKTNDSSRCETNPARDSLEFALIKEAMRLNMPVLGICRGQQILNVALGGTLIVDIPTDYTGNVIHRCDDYLTCFHPVNVVKGSLLYNITNAETGDVNTNHHQAIEKLAAGLKIVARSADSIPEAVEWIEPAGKPFFIAVQWHPERMDTESPFSMPLIKAFLEAANDFRKIR